MCVPLFVNLKNLKITTPVSTPYIYVHLSFGFQNSGKF